MTALLASDDYVFESAQALANELSPFEFKQPKHPNRSSDLGNYETQLAITELLFACERNWLDAIKSGLRANDAKEIAQVLKFEPQQLQLIFQLALAAGLIGQEEGRYVATQAGLDWLDQDPGNRWKILAGPILDLPKFPLSQEDLLDQLRLEYPLADPNELQILRFGHCLGLLDDLRPTPLLIAAQLDLANAAMLTSDAYPEPASRVILQGDLSIISPGPLSPQVHKQLDLIAESEDLGLACRFRLSLNSILHAMETGLVASEIEDLLTDLSGAGLPQPVSYLLNQAQRKFGELVVLAVQDGSMVSAKDPILLAQIRNDSRVAGLMLRDSEYGLVSRLGAQMIYFNLRAAGYPAVMVDEASNILSPRSSRVSLVTKELDGALLLARELIAGEAKAPSTDDHLRQLQFALKNKLQVGIRVDMPDGITEMVMTPLGISGGRFRGRDVVKEAERTLPLSRIQAVWLS
jgi:hypothetical protein